MVLPASVTKERLNLQPPAALADALRPALETKAPEPGCQGVGARFCLLAPSSSVWYPACSQSWLP